MQKIYESWIWHKSMGHVHLKNLVKVSKKCVVRSMPKIKKLSNIGCKHHQFGKQTRV